VWIHIAIQNDVVYACSIDELLLGNPKTIKSFLGLSMPVSLLVI